MTKYTRKEVGEMQAIVARSQIRGPLPNKVIIQGMLVEYQETLPRECSTCGGDGKCQTCDGSGDQPTTLVEVRDCGCPKQGGLDLCYGCTSMCDIVMKGRSSWGICQFCRLPHPSEMVDSSLGTC